MCSHFPGLIAAMHSLGQHFNETTTVQKIKMAQPNERISDKKYSVRHIFITGKITSSTNCNPLFKPPSTWHRQIKKLLTKKNRQDMTGGDKSQARILWRGGFLECAPGTLIITWLPCRTLNFDPDSASLFCQEESQETRIYQFQGTQSRSNVEFKKKKAK